MASRSVTVLADDAFNADAWSKVLIILGPGVGTPLAERLGLEVVYVDADDRLRTSRGLAIVRGDPATAIAGELLVLHPPTEGSDRGHARAPDACRSLPPRGSPTVVPSAACVPSSSS